jgi:hypothetical protein
MFNKIIPVEKSGQRERKTRETGGEEKTKRRSSGRNAREEITERKRSDAEEGRPSHL